MSRLFSVLSYYGEIPALKYLNATLLEPCPLP
jgi:hypothetical protein